MKRLFIVFLMFLVSTGSFAGTILPTTEKVEMTGKLVVKDFVDANDKPESAYILILDEPIDVAGDDMDSKEAYGIKEIQVAFIIDDPNDANVFLDKKIRIKGNLFHSFTAHHHTKILLAVDREDFKKIAVLN